MMHAPILMLHIRYHTAASKSSYWMDFGGLAQVTVTFGEGGGGGK